MDVHVDKETLCSDHGLFLWLKSLCVLQSVGFSAAIVLLIFLFHAPATLGLPSAAVRTQFLLSDLEMSTLENSFLLLHDLKVNMGKRLSASVHF